MKEVVLGKDLGGRFIEIFGLPENTFDFNIHFPIDGVVEVNCTYCPSIDSEEADKVAAILSEYELCEKEVDNKSGGVE